MKKCIYCGREHPDEANVCTLDGQPLVRIDSAGQPMKQAHAATKRERWRRPYLPLAAAQERPEDKIFAIHFDGDKFGFSRRGGIKVSQHSVSLFGVMASPGHIKAGA